MEIGTVKTAERSMKTKVRRRKKRKKKKKKKIENGRMERSIDS